jgi:ankyrin repeat protein
MTPDMQDLADDEDDLGRTPLHFAAEMGHVEVCEALLGSAPDIISVKANGLFGSTALHTAAAAGQLPIVRFLLEREADVLLKNINGMTALHIAAGLGDLEICRCVRGLIPSIHDMTIKGQCN